MKRGSVLFIPSALVPGFFTLAHAALTDNGSNLVNDTNLNIPSRYYTDPFGAGNSGSDTSSGGRALCRPKERIAVGVNMTCIT